MIITGSDIDIFDINGNKIAEIGFAGGLFKRELMNEHYIQLSLNYTEYFEFGRGMFVKYQDRIYTIRKESLPEQKGLYELRYTLKFEAIEMFFLDFVLFYTFQGFSEAAWTLTGTPQQFLQIALVNINEYFGLMDEADKWKIGVFPVMTPIEISFENQNTFDGLTNIAEKFGAEWWLDYESKTLNLGYYESESEAIDLEIDQALKEFKRSNENNDDYCTRLFAFGGARNIPTNYRGIEPGSVVDALVQKRLRLPASNGDFIDAIPNMLPNQIIERVKFFDHIFPQRTGEITSLRIDDTQKDQDGNPWLIFYFKDSGLNFSEDYILPGQTLKLTFGDNSWLAGRTFELEYHPSTIEGETGEFEIINDQSLPNITIPNDILRPKVGDFYTLFNFDISLVGDQYVGEAEQLLLEEATEWMESVRMDNSTYTCPVDPVWAYHNELSMGLGQRVNLISDILKYGIKESRVFGYEKSLETFEDTYTIGDKPRYSRLKTIDKTIETNREIADLQYLEAMRAANGALRNVKALNYLRIALENNTTIEGGLILTTLIRLGHMVGNVWKENAGISGIVTEAGDDPFLWGGGTFDDAIESIANIILRMDGSGQLAKGNILWDALGNILMRGLFESNKDGNRIIIDPEDRSIKLIDANGDIYGRWVFSEYGSRFELEYNNNKTRMLATGIESQFENRFGQYGYGGMSVSEFDSSNKLLRGFRASIPSDTDTLEVITEGLPENSLGLRKGQHYCGDDGIIRMVK
ncbi:hypothetical protein CLV62_1183 [Dysgonomonas alginatilytica]|uniref:Uncharacterized protein n=1 Tax=Dysgonomonas alginatilytica TaxID=1605892 RepID=A0A2V3PP82_9BACT|nr:hypothetical protein [Dysgonomonas alginatilytica]PXV62616.1 hypothetical protein CLV62_1183 [Dysgonomonas alginatilytica]